MEITRGKVAKAQKVVVYGPEGIGKTTFAASFPDPLFIDSEGGTYHLDVARFGRPSTWQMLMEQIAWARDNASPGSTLVVDTLDWAERLCAEHVCRDQGLDGIEAAGYGKGYVYVKEAFAKMLDALSDVAERGVNVVCTAHACISKFEPPDSEAPYDRWSLKLNDSKRSSVAAIVKEWADALLFANYKTSIEVQGGKARAVSSRRVLFCNHSAAFDAKNRWGLPNEVPFAFESVAAHIAGATGARATERDRGQAAGLTQERNPVGHAEHKPPVQAPEAGAERPAQAGGAKTGAAVDRLAQLRELMAEADIDDALMMRTVESQRYVPNGTPLENYRPELLDRLISKWGAVKGVAEGLRDMEVPF